MSPPSVDSAYFLLSDWILKRVPGGLVAELVLLRQSVGSWHPRSANTSLLRAFETSGAQTFLNCCIFSECLFCHSAMTHFFFFFFQPQSWWRWAAKSHGGRIQRRKQWAAACAHDGLGNARVIWDTFILWIAFCYWCNVQKDKAMSSALINMLITF